MNKIYLASTWFEDKSNTYQDQLYRLDLAKKMLKNNKTVSQVYVPNEHQSELEPQFGHEWRTETFNADLRHVYSSDVVVALADFNTNGSCDDGISFELGCAYTSNIPIILVRVHNDQTMNLMLADSLTAFLDKVEDLKDYDFNQLNPIRMDNNVI